MMRLTNRRVKQLPLCLDEEERRPVTEEIREAVIATLAELLLEAFNEEEESTPKEGRHDELRNQA